MNGSLGFVIHCRFQALKVLELFDKHGTALQDASPGQFDAMWGQCLDKGTDELESPSPDNKIAPLIK